MKEILKMVLYRVSRTKGVGKILQNPVIFYNIPFLSPTLFATWLPYPVPSLSFFFPVKTLNKSTEKFFLKFVH